VRILSRCTELAGKAITSCKPHIPYIALLWGLICIPFGPVIFSDGSLVPSDILYTMEPWYSELGEVASSHNVSGVLTLDSIDAVYTVLPVAHATQRQLRGGHLPIWDPDILTGFPLGAFSPLYPFQILAYLILAPETALNALVIFHLFLISLFGYFVVTSLDAHPLAGVLAGLVAAINAMVLYYLIAPGMLLAIAWILGPFLCFIRFRRSGCWRWTIAAGLCYGMLQLTANPQLVLYTSLAYGFYVLVWSGTELWRREYARAGRYLMHSIGMVLIGVLIGLPSLLLMYHFSLGVQRAPQVKVFTELASWIRVIVPDYWGTPSELAPGFSNNTRLYIGVLPLVLAGIGALAARKLEARCFAFIAGAFAAVTLGWQPFSTIFYLSMPELFLDHGRVLVLSSLLLAVCAGLGADVLLRNKRYRSWAGGLLMMIAAGVAGMLIVVLTNPTLRQSDPFFHVRLEATQLALTVTLVGLAAVAAMSWTSMRVAGVVLILAVAFDLFATFWLFFGIFPAGLMLQPPLIERLAERVNTSGSVPARVFFVEGDVSGPKPKVLTYFDIPQITGYTSLPSERYNRYTFASGARRYESWFWLRFMEVEKPRVRLFDALAAEYVLLWRDEVIDGEHRTPLLAEVPREALQLSRYQLRTLPAEAADLKIATDVPEHGRSFLLTGLAVLDGSMGYEIRVDGESVHSGHLAKTTEIPFWKALATELSPHAGHLVTIELLVTPGPGASWRWVDPQLHFNPEEADLELVDAGGLLVYRNHNAFPRAWLVSEILVVPPDDLDRAESEVSRSELDLRRVAIVESGQPLSLGRPSPSDRVEITRYEPSLVEVHVSTTEARFLVMPDLFHKAWRANIDGEPSRIFATNLTMRGVLVAPGQHRVTFELGPPGFRLSLFFSGISILLCVSALVVTACKRGACTAKEDAQP